MTSGSRVFQFLTHDGGFPLTSGFVVDQRADPAPAPLEAVLDLAKLANRPANACAFGKIALISADGISTFQSLPDNRLTPSFCGNSTAAAVHCMAAAGEDVISRVHGASSISYSLTASIDKDIIRQSWLLPAPVVEEIEWHGRRVLLLRSLNDYAIVLGDIPAGMSPEMARTELLGLGGCTKLAVVTDGGNLPSVQFYNSNGQHGAVPQTGLASLALASRCTPRLADVLSDGFVSYLTTAGIQKAALPELDQSGSDNLTLTIGPISVGCEPVASRAAA